MPQSYSALWFHLVFATKDRERFLDRGIRPRVHDYLGGIVGRLGGITRTIGGVEDHVHALIQLPQERSVAEVVRFMKANSCRWIHERLPGMASFAWQNGYAAFSVSVSQLDRVGDYVAGQEAHHRAVDFGTEWSALLARHLTSPVSRAHALG